MVYAKPNRIMNVKSVELASINHIDANTYLMVLGEMQNEVIGFRYDVVWKQENPEF
jgi:predicted phage gp36 major capsid-like protein